MKAPIYTLFLISLLFIGCKKEAIQSNDETIKNIFIDSAVQFLKSKLSAADFNTLNVKSFRILSSKNENIGAKIFEKGLSADHFIILKKETRHFNGNWVSISGINSKISKEHTGSILLQSLDRKLSQKLIVENNEVTQIITTDNTGSKVISLTPSKKDFSNSGITQRAENYVLPEVVVVAYIHTVQIDFWSLYWLFNQFSYYNSYYTPNDGGFGGGGSGGGGGYNSIPSVVAAPKLYPPDKPVADVKNEVKCFTNNSSSTYSITVNVNQPVPGSREVFDPLASFTVGHTYLTLEQINVDGSKIIRNLGFYPKNLAKPGSEIDKSTFGDDSNTPFDVSLKIYVSGSDFLTVLNNLIRQQSMNYDLNNFNCTNSPINALNSINVHLPSTKSSNVLFSGNNPADLGEDIRGLNLDNFRASNGGRKMARSQNNSNSQKPPSKTGGC